MTTLAAQITSTGIVVPDYADVLAELINLYESIYGSDTVLTPNTQDGQFLGVLAQAITDCNQLAAGVYNAYSPVFAQGAGLSSVVKINGIRRNVPGFSTCVVTIVGQANRIINQGQVGDNQGLNTVWLLPPSVTIPFSGTIDVLATCAQPGAVTLGANQLTVILTPTLGWQTVTNGSNVPTPGATVETDAALRVRQTQSTAGPALTPTEAIFAAVAEVAGVSDTALYNNDTGVPDGNGVPAHSIAVVVVGGATTDVATAIFNKKAPGTGTYGTTSVTVVDQNGVPDTINFFEAATTEIWAIVTVTPLPGFTTAASVAIQQAVLAYISQLPIGQPVVYFTLAGIATLQNTPYAGTFKVEAVTVGTGASPVGTVDVSIAFNAIAASQLSQISIVS